MTLEDTDFIGLSKARIHQALVDLSDRNDKVRGNAVNFFGGGEWRKWCGTAGYDDAALGEAALEIVGEGSLDVRRQRAMKIVRELRSIQKR